MAIFTRWGDEITVSAYCGKHQPKWAGVPLILLKVKYQDDHERFAHPVNFKADGGWAEIDAAVDAAPVIELGPKELKAALKEAE